MSETVVIESAPPVVVEQAPTVHETVQVAQTIVEAAQRLATPDVGAETAMSELRGEVAKANERIAFLAGEIETMKAAQVVAAVEEEIEETPVIVEAPAIEAVPEESIPKPEAPSIRPKKKRYFI